MNQKGFALWLTGLPCSGKSSIAAAVTKKLRLRGCNVERLDGDVVRNHLWSELGYSKEHRDENIRRVTFLANLLVQNGIVAVTSFISPYRDIRDYARREIGDFIEVYVKCPLEVCFSRDIKGMYKQALVGEIKNFTGISDPYEEPLNPEITVETDREPLDKNVAKIIETAEQLGYLDITHKAISSRGIMQRKKQSPNGINLQ